MLGVSVGEAVPDGLGLDDWDLVVDWLGLSDWLALADPLRDCELELEGLGDGDALGVVDALAVEL